jgi:hypothetical protein
MSRSAYTLMLDDLYIADLERLAGELGATPSEIVPMLTGKLSHRDVRSGIVVVRSRADRGIMMASQGLASVR